jgi:hypothetical protein
MEGLTFFNHDRFGLIICFIYIKYNYNDLIYFNIKNPYQLFLLAAYLGSYSCNCGDSIIILIYSLGIRTWNFINFTTFSCIKI